MDQDILELDSYIDKQVEFYGEFEDFPMSTIDKTLELCTKRELQLEMDSDIDLELRDTTGE
jgi:hypothetical protein